MQTSLRRFWSSRRRLINCLTAIGFHSVFCKRQGNGLTFYLDLASIKSSTIQFSTWFACELKNIFDLIGYAEGVASCATVVFTLYVRLIAFVKSLASLPFTSFLISGSSGVGGVTRDFVRVLVHTWFVEACVIRSLWNLCTAVFLP